MLKTLEECEEEYKKYTSMYMDEKITSNECIKILKFISENAKYLKHYEKTIDRQTQKKKRKKRRAV